MGVSRAAATAGGFGAVSSTGEGAVQNDVAVSPSQRRAPLNHYRVTGTRKGNRTYFEDNKGRRWMMIEEDGRTTVMPR